MFGVWLKQWAHVIVVIASTLWSVSGARHGSKTFIYISSFYPCSDPSEVFYNCLHFTVEEIDIKQFIICPRP